MGTYAVNKRWLKRNPEKRKEYRQRYYDNSKENSTNKNSLWSEDEVKMITAPKKPPDSILSVLLGRSVKAIQGKRRKVLLQKKELERISSGSRELMLVG